jgi:general secretion pathway protein C
MVLSIPEAVKSRYNLILGLINTIIGISLFALVLLSVRDIISEKYKKEAPAPKAYNSAARQVKWRTFQDYAPVVTKSLFSGSTGELKQLTVSSDKETVRTDLTLIGTIASSGSFGYAIFSDKSNNQALYKIGDKISGLGTVIKIEKDKVSVDHNRNISVIPLADIVVVTEVKSPQDSSRPSALAKNIGESAYIVDQNKIRQAIEKPNQIMTDARFLPNVVDGKQQGYILNEVKPGGIYQNLGLQNSDVLLRINDYNISNPENALQAFNALKGMDRVTLDIIRGGAKMTMTYQLK